METKKLSPWKKFWIVLLAIVSVACVTVDVWYAVIYFYGDEKLVINTYEIGLQETTSGDAKYFIEIKYFSNKNENGLEMMDIKFNYLLDENQDKFYSQGLQYVANSENDAIQFLDLNNLANSLDDFPQYQNAIDQVKELGGTNENIALNIAHALSDQQFLFSKGGWYDAENYYADYYKYEINETKTTRYNYASANDYVTSSISTNPISQNSVFRIQLDDKLYAMKFKGSRYNTFAEATFEENVDKFKNSDALTSWSNYQFNLLWAYTDYYNLYPTYDDNYFSYLLYNAVKSLTPGTNRAIIFELADLFNFYEYDDEGQYSDTAIKDTSLIEEAVKNYYAIKVEVSADGARKASDSLFNMIYGSSSYNTTGNFNDDYFTGQTIVNCDIDDFEKVEVTDGYYALKLSNKFMKDNYEYRKNICLSITINLDLFKEQNITFVGFTNNSGLSNFNIRKCVTTETIDGHIVETEVKYA